MPCSFHKHHLCHLNDCWHRKSKAPLQQRQDKFQSGQHCSCTCHAALLPQGFIHPKAFLAYQWAAATKAIWLSVKELSTTLNFSQSHDTFQTKKKKKSTEKGVSHAMSEHGKKHQMFHKSWRNRMNIPLPEPRSGIYLEEHSTTLVFQFLVLNSLAMSQNSYQTQSICVTLREVQFKLQTDLQAELPQGSHV